MSPLKDFNDVKHLVDEEALVIKRSLNIQIKKDDIEQYRENIFHTRCHINNKVCSMIINNENYVNVMNITLVKKLNMNTIKHEGPYRVQWLNDCGEVRVTKHVLVSIFLVENIKMRFCVMLGLYVLLIYYEGDLSNLI